MTSDDALAELSAELALWPGKWWVTEIRQGTSWGTHGPGHTRKEDVGAYRQTWGGSWSVTAAEDGWEHERETFTGGGTSIAAAAIKVRDHMQQRREDPHYAHIEDHWIVADCEGCAKDVTTLGLEGEPLPVYV